LAFHNKKSTSTQIPGGAQTTKNRPARGHWWSFFERRKASRTSQI